MDTVFNRKKGGSRLGAPRALGTVVVKAEHGLSTELVFGLAGRPLGRDARDIEFDEDGMFAIHDDALL